MAGAAAGGGDGRNFPVPRARISEGFLPSTAPVSSLLPPIPANHHHHAHAAAAAAAASIQAQLAAFLTQGSAPQQQLQQQQHAPSALNLAAAASATHPSHLLARSTSGTSDPLISNVNMHGWSVDQVENHIKLLRQLKQNVPQNVTLLLQEAKKRAEKRHAKRIANRKSACTSRARKKALVQEMTALNARLRRQALILSLLPDLVIVIDPEGTITFCSAQVERVLQHGSDDLIGAKLSDIIVPSSRDKLSNLIQELLSPGQTDQPIDDDENQRVAPPHGQQHGTQQHDSSAVKKKKAKLKKDDENNEESAHNSVESAKAVTDSSFPLSVVVGKVDQAAAIPGSSDENDNSDGSNISKQLSSLTTNSSTGNGGSNGGTPKKDGGHVTKKGVASSSVGNTKKLSKKESISQSSDSSNTSSNMESANVNNLLTANANLERNVRWHNNKIMKRNAGFKDDVLGAAVTANNASARLSSLQHLRSSDSSEEDSGYRESNDSREETSSSEEETSSRSNGRRQPIAPTINVCLIRDDLTTIWCEVTSSVRTKDTEDETDDINSIMGIKRQQMSTSSSTDGDKRQLASPASIEKASRKRGSEEASRHGSDGADDKAEATQSKEILLCLRPIRDGDEKTDEAHRFKPSKNKEKRTVSDATRSEESNSSKTDGISGDTTNSSFAAAAADPIVRARGRKRSSSSSRPFKQCASPPCKRHRSSTEEDANVVVESLMSMSSQKT